MQKQERDFTNLKEIYKDFIFQTNFPVKSTINDVHNLQFLEDVSTMLNVFTTFEHFSMVHPERFGITLDTIPAWIEESEKIIFE